MPKQLSNRHVAILAYDQLCMFEFGIALEVFGLPRPEFAHLDWYSYEIVGIEPGPYRSTGGNTVDANHDHRRLNKADLIIVQWQNGEPFTVVPANVAVKQPIWHGGK